MTGLNSSKSQLNSIVALSAVSTLTQIGQHGSGAALTAKVRQVSIVYTSLSTAGPLVSGFVVNLSSSHSLFWQQLVVIFVLLTVLFKAKSSD